MFEAHQQQHRHHGSTMTATQGLGYSTASIGRQQQQVLGTTAGG